MSNAVPSHRPRNKVTAKWHRRLARWATRRQERAALDALLASTMEADLRAESSRPPPEPPPTVPCSNLMTNLSNSDNDNMVFGYSSDSDVDSLFADVPSLDSCSVPSLGSRSASSSDASLDGSCYDTAVESASFSSDTSSCPSITSLGPPPPGSLMHFWNSPINTADLHHFASRYEDLKCAFAQSSSDDDSTVSSVDFPGLDDDTYAEFNPASPAPAASLRLINATARLAFKPVAHVLTPLTSGHELVDSGGNFSMTNRRDQLLELTAIRPFTIGMAAQENQSTSRCTHRGLFPIPMMDGSTFYTPMFYNPQASETILSPQAICATSGGLLDLWTQSGSVSADSGSVSFFDTQGKELIALQLEKSNGLFYTPVSAIGVEPSTPKLRPEANYCIYFHRNDVDDLADEVSLDADSVVPTSSRSSAALQFDHMCMPPMSIPTPKSSATSIPEFVPKHRQVEADLWQARLGHCSDWQLKVIPMSTTGTPSRFYPHPFASYDHYNQARIRKRPATRGKHPSRATNKEQRFSMDFGFFRASQADYSRPDKTKERVVKSFDGYNSYLAIVDDYTKYIWIYLCVSKEPPIELIKLHLDQYGSRSGGYIRCDNGGELAGCQEFLTEMTLRGYIVEPTGSDSPDQNKGVEKWNDTLAVTTRVLLYGSGLPATFWSAALQHAAYLHNRRVHRTTLCTPFEAWFGFKPDLRRLRVFGSRVCVKRTGKRRSKLDKHDFSGIFLGFTATDENIRYVDVNTRIVKTSHHAIFDEAWYLHPRRPPFAQMLYDVGLEKELTEIDVLPTVQQLAVYPPPAFPAKVPPNVPLRATLLPLPLRASTPPNVYTAAAALTTVPSFTVQTSGTTHNSLDHEIMSAHDISVRDLETFYLSPSPYNNSFEEEFSLRTFDPNSHPTAGFVLDSKDNKLFLRDIVKSTPAAKIRAWRSRLRHAWLIKVNSTPVTSVDDVINALLTAASQGKQSCTCLFAHSAIKEGLVESGIPQINIDQLNHRYSLADIHTMTQHEYDTWFTSLPTCFYEVVRDGGVMNFTTACHKLTRRILLKQDDWLEWRASEFKQLDQYESQFMFGDPCPPKKSDACFYMIWTYSIKTDDGRKKARMTCDGSTRGGQVRVLDHVHANSLDQTSSRMFYALAAVEVFYVFGSDASNAFGEAPPPKQGFFIRPDDAFREWWASKGRKPIPPGWVIPVLAAMQGHPEASRLWEKFITKILVRELGLIATVHEPCLYSGTIEGHRVILKRQVDDFALATARKAIADKVFDLIDSHLKLKMRRQGIIAMYNGLDLLQSRWYIKISLETWLAKTLLPYRQSWLEVPNTPHPLPLGNSESFLKRLYSEEGNPDPAIQQALEKSMGVSYRKAVGEAVWAMNTCRPDIAQAVIKCAQHSACPAEVHFHAIRSVLRYLAATQSDGIVFWRTKPLMDLPDDPLPVIHSTPHDLRMDGRPNESPSIMNGITDTGWGSCLLTRRSFGGVMMRLAGGPVAYKAKLQPTVALSSTEAEFMNYTDAGRISLYCRSILFDLDVPQLAATIIYGDNDGATAMANAGKPTPRSRHIDIKYYAIQEWTERDLILIQRIPTAINMTDTFTKPLTRILFYRHRDYLLGYVPPTYSPRYKEVARIYLTPDSSTIETARAATMLGPWDYIIQSMYLQPLAFSHSNSTRSLERGRVTDTYDSHTLDGTSDSFLHVVDRANRY